jgi:hypothetical protein
MLTTAADSILKSAEFISQSRNFPPCMQPAGSLKLSLEPATKSHLENTVKKSSEVLLNASKDIGLKIKIKTKRFSITYVNFSSPECCTK